MKLASLKSGGRDGTLIVVNRELTHYVLAAEIAPTLQQAIENWSHAAPRLNALSQDLNEGSLEASDSISRNSPRLFRVPLSFWTAAPICHMSTVFVAPAAPKCRQAFMKIRSCTRRPLAVFSDPVTRCRW